MSKGLKKYLIENRGGLLTLDFERLGKISNKVFRKIHVDENDIFIGNHIKQTGHKPICEYCRKEIEKPKDLVRDHGGSSHIWCFEPLYYNELRGKFCEDEKKYFDRIIDVFS